MSTRTHVVLLIFALQCFGCATAPTESIMIVPPGESAAGQTQEAWSIAWWKWAGSFSREESPVADRTGALCRSKQEGPVWFLAGTYETRRTIRECTVPTGKYLFFPLINYVVTPARGSLVMCEGVTLEAARITDGVSALILEVDGVRFENLLPQRQATKSCFTMGSLADGQTPVSLAAANGYYVMLRPLARGRHTLNFGGALPSTLQAVTYTINVE